jgi:hypothetical protein
LTKTFAAFTANLKPSKETIENLRRTFRGLFAILDIGWQVIKGIGLVFKILFGELSKGSGGFLKFTAAIGDWLTKLDESLKKGNKLRNFFITLGNILKAPIQLLHALGQALSDAFAGLSFGGVGGGIDGVTKKLSPLQRAMEAIATAWGLIISGIANSGKVLQPIVEGMAKAFGSIGALIGQAFQNMNFQAILAVVRTGLLVGLVQMFRKFLGKGSAINQITKGFGGGILANIKGTFSALQGSMVAMQQNIKADTLKKIAVAVALLAVSVLAISMVDPKRLSSSLGAMTVMFGQLLASMAVMERISTSKGFLKMPGITFALIGLAIAIDTLSIAVIASVNSAGVNC